MIRRKGFGVSLAVGLALVAGACGSEGSSSEGSVRTKNAALPCVVGGYGPAGGIVMKVGATTADQSIEVSRDWFTAASGDPVVVLASVNAFATDLSKKTKPGWFIPDQATLKANLSLLQAVKGQEFYWTSSPIMNGSNILGVWGVRGDSGRDSLVNSYDIYLYRAVAFRTFLEKDEPCMTPPTTTTVAPTTTLPLTCAAGGLCAVGDTGPGGGRIFTASTASDGSSSYLEMAPADWAGATPSTWMVSPTRRITAPDSTGDRADGLASGYKGGGKSDWRLPNAAEMIAICGSPNNTLRPGAGMWATDGSTNTGKSRIAVSGGCRASAAGGVEEGEVRPVRTNTVSAAVRQAAVDYYVVNPTTTTSTTLPPTTTTSSTTTTSTTSTTTTTTIRPTTTTTIRPTTTTARPTTTTTTVPLVPCVDLSKCLVGQRGPGGGVIIRVSEGPTYLEMAPAGWSGGGRDPLVSAAVAAKTASDYRGGGKTDWRLPIDIETVCKFATRQLDATESYCPEPTGKIDASFGDGTGARFASFYWYGPSPATTPDQMDFASTRRMRGYRDEAYVRPVRSWTYVPPTTTTTVPPRCGEVRGKCKIGDISPTGGLIIDFSTRGGTPTYTEVAPKTWFESIKPKGWTGSLYDPMFPRADAVANIAKLAALDGKSWSLPTDRQMRAALLFFAGNPTFAPDCSVRFDSWRSLTLDQRDFGFGGLSYWITSPVRSSKFDNFNFATGAAYYDVASFSVSNVRPFAERPYLGGDNPQPATWSPAKCETQVIPTTTTTTQLVSCAGGGRCNIGDIGPNRGIIIGIKRGSTPGDVTYTEMQGTTNPTFDCQGTSWGNSCTTGQYDDFVRTRGRNGVFDDYPTTAELRTVAASPTIKAALRLRNAWYFSSTYRASATLTADVNADSIKDLGRSLELQDTTLGIAIFMGNGSSVETQYAYFRGVNHWKCRFSCIGG